MESVVITIASTLPLMKAMLFAHWSDELSGDVSDFHYPAQDYTPHS
jgi:hypothetical protein